jgi:chromosome segregation ATPase
MLAAWTGATWDAMQALMTADEASAPRSTLDAVRAEIDRVSPPFEHALQGERARFRKKAEASVLAERAEWQRQLQETQQRLEDRRQSDEAERRRLMQCIARHQDDLAELQRQFTLAVAEREALARTRWENDESRTRLTFQIEELTRRSDWMIESMRARLEETEREITALRTSISWRATAVPRRIAGAWRHARERNSR